VAGVRRKTINRWVWSVAPAFVLLTVLHLIAPLRYPVAAYGLTAAMTLLLSAWMEWVNPGGRR
jgi:hypothetical protein